MDKIETYEDAAGQWRWRRISSNGEIIADSSEGYDSKENAQRAARRQLDQIGEIDGESVEPR